MKKFTMFLASVATALFGFATTASAQYETEQQIPWVNHASTLDEALEAPNGIYLCYMQTVNGNTTYSFVTAGGRFGTQAVTTNRGMTLRLTQSGNQYRFRTTMYNPNTDRTENYLGCDDNKSDNINAYMDNSDNQYSRWTLSQNGDGFNIINIREGFVFDRNYYLQLNQNNSLYVSESRPSNNGKWLLIDRDEFKEVITRVTGQTNIEVSGLFNNTRFIRYMDEAYSWTWYDINNNQQVKYEDELTKSGPNGLGISSLGAYRGMAPNVEYAGVNGDGYAESYGSFSAGEMRAPVIMRQQYTGLKEGTYIVTAQAFVSNDADVTAAANSAEAGAYLFASGSTGEQDGALIQLLNEDEQNDFTTKFYNAQKTYLGNDAYFRGNVAAGEFLATNNGTISREDAMYNPDMRNHIITIAVRVDEGGRLAIGVAKTENAGRAYFDNIRVWYTGNNEFGLDAYSTNSTTISRDNLYGIDNLQYGYPRVFNLSRDFGITEENAATYKPKWEALVSPVNLTCTQVWNTFGKDTQLSELVGLAEDGHEMRFKTVDLSKADATAIYAGKCYVIKVPKVPQIARFVGSDPTEAKEGEDKHEFSIFSTEPFIQGDITYYGPVYQFNGVTRTSTLEDLITVNDAGTYENGTVTKIYPSPDGSGDVKFTGYFYKPASVSNAYVVSRGNMYFLGNQSWKSLTGTMWTLEELNPENNNKLTFDFGDGETTGIEDLSSVTDDASEKADGVFNLNGQKVADGTSTEGLAKGIYVVGGKKIVVR
jgi:hypothetical protein